MWLSAPGIQFLLDGEWSFCLSPFFGHELDNLFGKLKVESGKWKAKNGKWKVDLTPILLSKSRKSTVFNTKLPCSPSILTVLAWICSLRVMLVRWDFSVYAVSFNVLCRGLVCGSISFVAFNVWCSKAEMRGFVTSQARSQDKIQEMKIKNIIK